MNYTVRIATIKIKPIACVPALAIAGFCMYFARNAAPQRATYGETKAIVTATTAFLNSLSAVQREKVQFPFVPEKTAKSASFARSDKGGGARGGKGPGGPDGPGGRGPGSPGGSGRPSGGAGVGTGRGFV